MPDFTSRRGLQFPLQSDGRANVNAAVQPLAQGLDNVAFDDQGTTVPSDSAGAKGDYFFKTDDGTIWRHDGTHWDCLTPQDAVAATPSLRTLGTGAQQAVAGNDARISVAAKPSCHVAVTTNINIANPGTLSYDSVTCAVGDRILLTAQSTTSQNGPWLVGANSSAALTRPSDWASGSTTLATSGVLIAANAGTANAGVWQLTAPTNNGITIDSSNVTWTKLITANEAAALAGTTGTPGSSNKYVTDQDLRLAGTHPPVRAVCDSNITTGNPGTLVYDGVTCAIGNRVLLVAQSTASQNGIWVVGANSSAALTRPTDYSNASVDALVGTLVEAGPEGTKYPSTLWALTTPTSGTVTVDGTGTGFQTVSNLRTTSATRPAATLVANGATHMASDTNVESVSTGAAWVAMGAGNGIQPLTATANISATAGRIVTFTGAAAQTLTLPAAAVGLDIDIYNIDASNSVTISRAGSDTIGGGSILVLLAGQRVRITCSAAGKWVTQLGFPADVQIFAVVGTPSWVMPYGAKRVSGWVIGGGGQGGGGQSAAVATARAGGGGGGPGGFASFDLIASDIGAAGTTVTVTVGAGGTGAGAGGGTGGASGSAGTAGSASSFGTFATGVGGGAGQGGAAGVGGAGGAGSISYGEASANGGAGGSSVAGTAGDSGSYNAPGAGGGGGGVSAANTDFAGGAGGFGAVRAGGSPAGGAGGAIQVGGGAATASTVHKGGGGGGGGGGSHLNTINGGVGSFGGAFGAGGGGGGAATSGGIATGGTGGNGNLGIVVVITSF